MAVTHKKVLVRRFLGDILAGYLTPAGFTRDGVLDLMDLEGRVNSIVLSEVKYISYVRDFNFGDTANPERLSRRTFLARPRAEGLWVRITFRAPNGIHSDPRSPDLLEGLAAADTTFVDDLLQDSGLYITPPDIRSNTQRLFIPRSAVSDLQILAVITSPSRRKTAVTAASDLQEELFQVPLAPNTRPN